MQHADEMKGKIGENLRAALEQLPLSRELATIHCHVKLENDLESLVPGEEDREALLALYQELEFKSWVAELEQDLCRRSAGCRADPAGTGPGRLSDHHGPGVIVNLARTPAVGPPVCL